MSSFKPNSSEHPRTSEEVEGVLIDWLDGAVSELEARAALGRLGASAELLEPRLAVMRRVKSLMRSSAESAVPEALTQRVKATIENAAVVKMVGDGENEASSSPVGGLTSAGVVAKAANGYVSGRAASEGAPGRLRIAGSSREFGAVGGTVGGTGGAWFALAASVAIAAVAGMISVRGNSTGGAARVLISGSEMNGSGLGVGLGIGSELRSDLASSAIAMGKAREGVVPSVPFESDKRVAGAALASAASENNITSGENNSLPESGAYASSAMAALGDVGEAYAKTGEDTTMAAVPGQDGLALRLVLDPRRASELAREGRLLVRVVSENSMPLVQPLAPSDSRWHVEDEVTRAMLEAVRPYFAASTGVVPPTQVGPNEGRFLTEEMYGPPASISASREASSAWLNADQRSDPATYVVHLSSGFQTLDSLRSALIAQHRGSVLFEELAHSLPADARATSTYGADEENGDVSVPVIIEVY